MVVTALPAKPESRLSAPSSASMNASAFFSASSEIADGSAAAAGLASSAIVPSARRSLPASAPHATTRTAAEYP